MSTQETEPDTVGFRLSPQQEHMLVPGAGGSVVQCAALLSGSINEARLRDALEQVVARHEILRTTFAQPAGMRAPQQVIHEHLAPFWATRQASATELSRDGAALAALLESEAGEGFDLEHGPLIRGLLVCGDQDAGLLALTAPAACADVGSIMLLLGEVADRYIGRDSGAEPIQYADYAEWRHELAAGDEPEADEGRTFWSEDAADRPAPPLLLFGSSRAGAGTLRSLPVDLDAAGSDTISHAADRAGVTVPMLLEAAWHALIAGLCGATEVLCAGWFDGRSQPDLESAVGAYAQPAPVRTRFEAETSFAETLDQVKRARVQGARWQDYASAADLSALTRDAPVGFAAVAIGPVGEPILEVVSTTRRAMPLALLLGVTVSEHGLGAELSYDEAAFEERDAEDIARRFAILLESAVADPTQPVHRLALVDPAERSRLIADAAGPEAVGRSSTPFHHLFEERAAEAGERIAASSPAGDTTYAELNETANRLAHHLREAGVGPGATVGLCMERTPSMLAALVGILKAGAAYVPLNFEHPATRLAHQLSETQSAVLVSEQHLLERLSWFDGATVCPDRDAEVLAGRPSTNPDQLADSRDLAYVIYTSGSTGTPKGVRVTHANLSAYATYMVGRLGIGDPDQADGLRFGVVSAISTDLGNTSIFPALIAGSCVQLISVDASMDSDALMTELGALRLNVLKIAPSHLRALLAGDRAAEMLPNRWLVLGGEPLPWELVAQIRSLSPACRLMNHYGPTETTIGCCTYDVDERQRADSATVPIGLPIGGARAYVLDSNLEPIPAGVPGELCVAGGGVAAGYVGAADAAAGRFLDDPFAAAGSRMYLTGDRVRRLRDGAIEFLGRVDDQVKIRGFRIEPREIEAALAQHPAIRQAAVTAEHDDRGQLRLVAYLVAAEAPSVQQLQAFLAEKLPDYMIPATFATLEAMPFTPSGKIDRKALPELAAVQTRREEDYVAPRDEIEQQIADIWSELLGVERVGVNDDFFALGGHSLLATQAIMRIRRLHGDVPLRALLAAPTVAALAEVVRSSAAPTP